MQTNHTLSIDSNWRPWPFFGLNDEFPPGEGEAIITESLEALKRAGYGGAFIHPRPGMICEYRSDRWFEVVRHTIAECRRLGMHPALYDENSYPSGFAGGHVPAEAPDTVVRYVEPIFGTGPIELPVGPLSLFQWDGADAGEPLQRDTVKEGESWVAFVMKTMEPTAWHGGFSYVSLLDPQVMPSFLKNTHEIYKDQLANEDWADLRAVFTDEPHLPAEHHGSWSASLHLTHWVRSQFRQQHGYDLVERLPDLYWNRAESAATRFDYYETLHDLWLKHWAKPYQAWTEENNLPLTGHYLEHDWPCPYASPGHVHLLKYMDWPGTDLLETYLLEGHEGGDPQNLFKTEPGREPQALYYLKQVHSVANQYSKERVVCESWGAGGNDSTPTDWLRIGRFLIVHGVNLLVPHLTPLTIRGSRKSDHPQFFSPHHPAFEYLNPMNDELGRLSQWAGTGHMENRILLLDPITTGYCASAKSDCTGMMRHHDESLRPDFVPLTQRSVSGLRETTTLLAQKMSEACIDFDIGDEYLLEEDGAATFGLLQLAKQSYQCIVIPPDLTNLRQPTLDLLESYLSTGGVLIACRPMHMTINGRLEDWSKKLDAKGTVIWLQSESEILETVTKCVPPRVKTDGIFPQGWAHQRRLQENQATYLFVNSGPEDWEGTIHVEESGSISVEDPATGLTTTQANSTVRVPRCAARLVHTSIDTDIPVTKILSSTKEPDTNPMGLSCQSICAAEKNRYIIDTCSSRINGISYDEELVYAANSRYWAASGMGCNGWHMLIQYRDQMFRRARELDPQVEASFTYHFTTEAGMPHHDWELGIEAPELWEVSVNGHTVDFSDSYSWRDPHIRVIAIADLARDGENTIILYSKKFLPIQEIDQIYLFGTFAVEPVNKGFHLKPAFPLELGSWKKQGRPFYDDAVHYRFTAPTNSKLSIQLPKSAWHGSLVIIESNNERQICYGPNIDSTIQVGKEGEFTLSIVGLPKNCFGPYRLSDPRPKRAWSIQWFGAGIPEMPIPGERYDLLDLGLLTHPIVTEID